MATRIKKKAAYHHGDLRQTLIDAALRIARDHGTRAITLADAARLAGVSAAAPYRHFADKEALLAAAAEACFVEFRTVLLAALATTTAPLEAFMRQGEAYLLYAREHPERIDLMFAMRFEFAAHPTLLQASGLAWEALLTAVRALASAQLIAADDVDGLALQVWYLTHGAATVGMGNPNGPDPLLIMRAGVLRLLGLPAAALPAAMSPCASSSSS
ncbi:MAG TPA: TetR family transcriptional regulator [Myxococcota bacterium]